MTNKTFDTHDIVIRSHEYAKALFHDDLDKQSAYVTGYLAAMNHAISENSKSHVYRTVARIAEIEGNKCYIVISAIDSRAKFLVNYNDLIYAMGVSIINRYDRFMINIDIGLENVDVVGFNIADRNIFVGAEWYE